jgi:hypothetical protein
MNMYRRARHKVANAVYRRLPRYREMQTKLLEAASMKSQIAAERRLSFLTHRDLHGKNLPIEVAWCEHSFLQDDNLLRRIQSAYRSAIARDETLGVSFWTGTIAEQKQLEHEALMADDPDAFGCLFSNPLNSTIFYGFDLLNKIETKPGAVGQHDFHADWAYDNLIRLCEAVGVIRLHYPETHVGAEFPLPSHLLGLLDKAFGFKVDFPNPYAGEVRFKTSRGIASYRAIQALYQAYLIARAGVIKVVEIGAGMGRTAYYANKFGIGDYTIVDLPMTNVAQGHFLGSAIGPTSVSLYGETLSAPIKIIPPADFFASEETYDLVVNVDSLTEMSRESASKYFATAAERSGALLSINHEFNPFTVQEISGTLKPSSRQPYWLRNGYVEELFEFSR